MSSADFSPSEYDEFMPTDPPVIVLFDGECNVCNASVDFLIRHDPGARFRFASRQSGVGQKLLAEHHVSSTDATVVVIDAGKVYTKSDASIRLARYVNGPWRAGLFLSAIPRGVRNWAYDVFARYRYRLFGKRETCRVPTDEDRARFL
jgi:predicted DCC family thiol-disulfide oxidoreductase YuxK